jgi:hypothetical protein
MWHYPLCQCRCGLLFSAGNFVHLVEEHVAMMLYRRNTTSVQLEGRERRLFLFTIKESILTSLCLSSLKQYTGYATHFHGLHFTVQHFSDVTDYIPHPPHTGP